MAKYKVGDRVRIVDHRTDCMDVFGGMDKWLGRVMTIKAASPYDYKMEEDAGEHLGDGWYWNDEMIAGLAEPMPEQRRGYDLKVVIRFSGNTTTARLMRGGTVVKTATARCNPKDEYSCAEGARIAVERLFEKKSDDKPKEASEPKIGDKFVVTGNSIPYHFFEIGEIVTLTYPYRDNTSLCTNAHGFEQTICNLDVKPYKGESK